MIYTERGGAFLLTTNKARSGGSSPVAYVAGDDSVGRAIAVSGGHCPTYVPLAEYVDEVNRAALTP